MKNLFKVLLLAIITIFAFNIGYVYAEEQESEKSEERIEEVLEPAISDIVNISDNKSEEKEETTVPVEKVETSVEKEEVQVPVEKELTSETTTEEEKVTESGESISEPTRAADNPTGDDTEEPTNDEIETPTIGKVNVRIIDSRTGNVVKTIELLADADANTKIKLSDLYPDIRYSTVDKEYAINETLYKHTFLGFFDASEGGNQIIFNYNNVTYPNLKTIYSNPTATSPSNYQLTLRAKSDLTTESTVDVYARFKTIAKPNGKITINIIDGRTGNVVDSFYSSATDSGLASVKLKDLFPKLIGKTISGKEYIYEKVEDKTYIFKGFFTQEENGILIDNSFTPGDLYPDLSTLKASQVLTSTTLPNYKLQVKAKTTTANDNTYNVYALWDLQEPHRIYINFYDVKPNDDGTTSVALVKTHQTNLIEPGISESNLKGLSLDQIFSEGDSSRPYSGVHDANSDTETSSDHIYKFLGWYDAAENGTRITSDYTLTGDFAKAFKSLTIPSNHIFGYVTNSPLDTDYTINVYGYWDSIKAPQLKIQHVNEVSKEGNTSWKNPNGTTKAYSHTYENPTDGPSTHKFKYWKVYKVNQETQEETEYDGIEYKDGNKFTYSFEGKEPGSLEVLIGRAWWQANVTLIIFSDGKEIGRGSDFESISISDVLENNPTKTGYRFLGWTDAKGKDVTETTFYPNKASTNPEVVTIKLYAKWEQIKIDVKVIKKWTDQNDNDRIRPDKVTVNIKNKDTGKVVDTTTLSEDNNWEYTFNVPEYEGENKVEYVVEEATVKGYNPIITGNMKNGFKIENVHENIQTEVSVSKEWSDSNNNDGKRPNSVTVNLLNGEEVVDSATLNDENKWTYTFKADKYNNGEEIKYTISENEVEGYTSKVTGSIKEGFVVTNTHEVETIKSITVRKEWDDNYDEDEIRPESITVYLLGNGEKVQEVVLSEKNNWESTFENVNVYDGGKEIEYTVSEEEIEFYEVTVDGSKEDGFTVINYHEPWPKGDGDEPEEPTNEDNNKNNNNPKTGDDIVTNIIMLLMSLTGLASGIIYLNKNKLAKNN